VAHGGIDGRGAATEHKKKTLGDSGEDNNNL
jgi:hypothetical protein